MATHIQHRDKHEAHKRLIERLLAHAGEVQRLAAGLEEEQLARRTVPGKWSLKELVCHLLRVQQVFANRIELMLAEENPAVPKYDPEGDPEFEKLAAAPGAGTLAAFLEGRERLTQRLERLTPADWHRKGRHPEFPLYDVHFQVEYMAHHEAHHVYQMFQRRVPLGKVPH